MSFALTTTKRKFHKILDSISNASSTSLAPQNDRNNASTTTLPTTVESAAKKPRISRPTSAYVPSTTNDTMRQSTSTQSSLGQSSPSSHNKERKAPNFAPWDRYQFLERLATFRHVDKWIGKPERINEVQWAKRGWTCVGKERVGCVGGCGREVVIKLEEELVERDERDDGAGGAERQDNEVSEDETADDWRENAQEQLVDKYAEMIVTEHGGGCLWRRKGCDDTVYRLPLAHQNTALDSLRLRYDSLVKMASDLPSNLSAPPSFDMNKISRNVPQILQSRPATPTVAAPPPSSNSEPLNVEAFTLALFGWQAEANHISGLATCTACFRRLGLWLFKSSLASSDGSQSNPASITRLDVIGEHRDYCPWVNGISQSGTAASQRRLSSTQGLPGWGTLLRVVVNAQEMITESKNSPESDADGAASEVASVASVASSFTGPPGKASRDEKDKARWAQLKRLKQVFNVRRGKGKGVRDAVRPKAAA